MKDLQHCFIACLIGAIIMLFPTAEQKPENDIARLKWETRQLQQMYDVPYWGENSFKTYMDYRAITCKTSEQYKLQQRAETNENGIRTLNGRLMIAVGTYYADRVGAELTVVLDTGVVLNCIVGDIKDDRHTDELNQCVVMAQGANVVEFIVDTKSIPKSAKYHGDMSYADERLKGNIEAIYYC